MRLFLLLVLASCGPEPDYVTSQGVNVWDYTDGHYVNMLEVEATIEVLVESYQGDRSALVNQLEGLNVSFQTSPIQYKKGETAAGTYTDWEIWVQSPSSSYCIAWTALVHELCHHVQEMVEHKPRDYYHEDEEIFTVLGSLERTAQWNSEPVCHQYPSTKEETLND